MSFGPFTLGDQLATNGLITSWKAFNANMQEHWLVAVPSRQISDPNAWARCVAEFETLKRAPASRLCAPVDWGEADGQYWAAYEWLSGSHLGRRAVEQGLPTAPVALNWGLQVLEALMTLQSYGQSHRLLSPASIFITELEQVKLLHAGWGGLLSKVSGGMMNPAFISVLPFTPPEMVAGIEVDEAADIYGLGASLYYLICGLPPHWADDPMSLCESIQSDAINFQPPSDYLTDAALELLTEMLANDPEDRPVNLPALHARLERVVQDLFSAYQQGEQEQTGAGAEDFSYPEDDPTGRPSPESQSNAPTRASGVQTPPAPSGAYAPPPPPTYAQASSTDETRRTNPAGNRGAAPPPPPPPPPPAAPAAAAAAPKAPVVTKPAPLPKLPSSGMGSEQVRLIIVGVAAFLVFAVVGYLGASFIFGGSDKDEAEATVGMLDAEKELATQQANANVYLATLPKLRRLANNNADYRRKYGVWARKVNELSEFGLLSADLVDSWGVPVDIREQYVVSAGADRNWDSGDDIYVDCQTGAWGGHFPTIDLKPERNKHFGGKLREMQDEANRELKRKLEEAMQ